jgi:hypothetical protein
MFELLSSQIPNFLVGQTNKEKILSTINVPSAIFKTTFLEHLDKKEQILNSISSIGICSVKVKDYSLCHTDWHLSEKWERPYWPLIKDEINKHVEEVSKKFGVSSAVINSFWVQQYGYEDYHDWHFHGGTMFSSVYYLELPAGVQTTFRFLGQEFLIDCKEGDIITFPSYLNHCSKPNKSGHRKTVISFNFSF